MYAGMEPYAFRRGRWHQLHEIAEVLDDTALTDLHDDRAADVLGRAEVLLTHWGSPVVDDRALDLAPNLRMVAHGAGTVKGIVDPAVFERGLLVTSAAAANARPVAEYTVAVILLANKDALCAAERERGEAGPALPAGFAWVDRSLQVGNLDKRIGIIGASHVGRLVIELLRPFDLEIVVADPYLDEASAATLGVQRIELDELLSTSDVVSIHAPELPSTRHLIDAPALARLGDGAVLINTARGSLVDHDALVTELATGRISAVLDVTDPEPLPGDAALRRLPNVFLTPHLAGSQGTEVTRMADLVLEEIARFGRGDRPRYPITGADLARIA